MNIEVQIGTKLRPWSQVEQDIVKTLNAYVAEFVRQMDLHLRSYNRLRRSMETSLRVETQPKKVSAIQNYSKRSFAALKPGDSKPNSPLSLFAREELTFWSEFPRNRKFHHAYLRKIRALLKQSTSSDPSHLRDIQLLLALCLDLLPQTSQDFSAKTKLEKSESSSDGITRNAWDLTDYSFLSDSSSNSSQALITSELQAPALCKEGKHLRRYLHQNRRRFDNIVEGLKAFDADSLANWQLVGDCLGIMVADLVSLLLEDNKGVKVSYGLVDALMKYSELFSKSRGHAAEAIYTNTQEWTVYDHMRKVQQSQWASIFGRLSALCGATFDQCLSFMNSVLVVDHRIKTKEELEDLAEQIFHCRHLCFEPSDKEKTAKILNLSEEIRNYLNSPSTSENFKIILLRTLKHLIGQQDFSSAGPNTDQHKSLWHSGVLEIYNCIDKQIIAHVFPNINSINFGRKVQPSHWDALMTPYGEMLVSLAMTIVHVAEDSFHCHALLRLLNWLHLPQMLLYDQTRPIGVRLLTELAGGISSPWKPKVDRVWVAGDSWVTPQVSKCWNTHRSIGQARSQVLWNASKIVDRLDPMYPIQEQLVSYGASFDRTFDLVFDPSKPLTDGHEKYLRALADHDLDFFSTTVVRKLAEQISLDAQSLRVLSIMLRVAETKLNPASVEFQDAPILRNYVSTVLKMLNTTIVNHGFLSEVADFSSSKQYQELCQEYMQPVWSKFDAYEAFEALAVAKQHTGSGATWRVDAERHRVTFEDLLEVKERLHVEPVVDLRKPIEHDDDFQQFYGLPNKFDVPDSEKDMLERLDSSKRRELYLDGYLNEISGKLNVELCLQRDKPGERFRRRQLMNYLLEKRETHALTEKQRDLLGNPDPLSKELLGLKRQVVRMLAFLPEATLAMMPCREQCLNDAGPVAELTASYMPVLKPVHYEDILAENRASLDRVRGILQGIQLGKSRLQSASALESPLPQAFLPANLLSTDYKVASAAGRSLQKLMQVGPRGLKLALLDQLSYLLKMKLIDTGEDWHAAVVLENLVAAVRLWRLSEVATTSKEEYVAYSNSEQAGNVEGYIFDLLDCLSLLSVNCKDALVRRLGLMLIAEGGKLRRLLCSADDLRKSLHELLVSNEAAIRQRVVERVAIMEMFRHQAQGGQRFTRTYDVGDIEAVLRKISLFKVLEDDYIYEEAKFTKWMACDIRVQVVGELITLWKNEFRNMPADQTKGKRDHRTIGLKLINLVHSIARKAVQLLETRLEAIKPTGKVTSSLTSILPHQKDSAALTIPGAIVLYLATAASVSEIDPMQAESVGLTSTLLIAPQRYSGIPHDMQHLLAELSNPVGNIVNLKEAGLMFSPQKLSVSSILLATTYLVQTPVPLVLQQQRLRVQEKKEDEELQNLQMKALMENQYKVIREAYTDQNPERSDVNYFLNSGLFHCLAFGTSDAIEPENLLPEYQFLASNLPGETIQEICSNLFKLIDALPDMLPDANQQMCQEAIKSILASAIAKLVTKKQQTLISASADFSEVLPISRMTEIVDFCQRSSLRSGYFTEKNRQSQLAMLRYSKGIGMNLDLEYMVAMQNHGYDVLQYYRVENAIKKEEKNQIGDIKLLINECYGYYRGCDNLQNPNPFLECLLSQIMPNGPEPVISQLREQKFTKVYEAILRPAITSQNLLESRLKKFRQHSMHNKYFVVFLTMSLCAQSAKTLFRCRLLMLAVLPLMFDEEEFREMVEEQLSKFPDYEKLCSDNTALRFIKMQAREEENYLRVNHFERYFSVNGILRSVLNEVIKLQAGLPGCERMVIRVLDAIGYFLGATKKDSGQGMVLRRAPKNPDQSCFLFDNLIDYKSYEFLQKLFKITERLVEYDDEMSVMNLWYKLVENQRANYEILAKFLIHVLSATLMKEDIANAKKSAQKSHEFAKQRRYALNILNFIKIRIQRQDIRNSLQVAPESLSWARKLVELLPSAQLSSMSKVVLEKVKLKKILQTMHREVNGSDVALRLKGGLDTEVLSVRFDPEAQESVRLSQLLESQTFLKAFAKDNRKESAIERNLLFNFKRIMRDKFYKVSQVKNLTAFPGFMLRYYENCLALLAADTNSKLSLVAFSKRDIYTVLVSMIVLMTNASERQTKILQDIYANIPDVRPFFQSRFEAVESGQNRGMVRRLLNQFKPEEIDNFDLFTCVFFEVVQNLSSDAGLRLYLLEFYNSVLKSVKEKNETSVYSLKNLRHTVLAVLESAYCGLLETASVRAVADDDKVALQVRNLRQHFVSLIEYVIYASEVDKLRQTREAKHHNLPSKQVIFATNTLFFVGLSCMEASDPKLQQVGTLMIRRTLEETSFVKMLMVFQQLSERFFAYSPSLDAKRASLPTILFRVLPNPLCTKDALKMLSISINVSDSRLLHSSAEQQNAEAIELTRLLCLLPYFLTQFARLSTGDSEAVFQNKSSMIRLLKKALPSIGIDKKRDIVSLLEKLQNMDADDAQTEVDDVFEGLIQATVLLMDENDDAQDWLKESYCNFVHFRSLLHNQHSVELSKRITLPYSNEAIVMVLNHLSTVVESVLKEQSIDQLKAQIAARYDQDSLFSQEQAAQGREILGEALSGYKPEHRSVYFGLKTIIVREIEASDRDDAVNEFFDRESSLSVKPLISQTESNQTSHQETTNSIPNIPQPSPVPSVAERMNPASSQQRLDLKDVGRTKTHQTVPIEELHTNSPSKFKDMQMSEEISPSKRPVNEHSAKQPRKMSYEQHKSDYSTTLQRDRAIAQSSAMHRSRRQPVDERSRSKSQNRYVQQESEEDLDARIEIVELPTISQRSGVLGRKTSDEQESNKSFADLTRQQQRVMGMQTQKDDGLRLEFQGISDQPLPTKAGIIINDDLMTFQRKKTVGEERKASEIHRKYPMQVPRTANPEIRMDSSTYQEEIESQDHRRLFQGVIDPKDNQSQASEVRRMYPEETKEFQRVNYQQKMVARPQTGLTRENVMQPKMSANDGWQAQKMMPSALQPGFVAEKSNQIWSDVASQKTQNLASYGQNMRNTGLYSYGEMSERDSEYSRKTFKQHAEIDRFNFKPDENK